MRSSAPSSGRAPGSTTQPAIPHMARQARAARPGVPLRLRVAGASKFASPRYPPGERGWTSAGRRRQQPLLAEPGLGATHALVEVHLRLPAEDLAGPGHRVGVLAVEVAPRLGGDGRGATRAVRAALLP